MTAYSRPYPRSIPRAAQVLAALTLGFGAFLALIVVWTLGYQLLYAGRIFPGVTVAGVNLSGLTPSDAALKLNQTLSFPISGKVVFRDGGNVWVASPVELGMVFDASSSAQAAYRLGRKGNPFTALSNQMRARKRGADVAPVIIFDQRLAYAYVNSLAAGINRPAMEASLKIEGTNIVAQAGQVGRRVNVDGTLVFLSAQLQSFRDVEVPLVIVENQPLIMDVSSQAEIARQILSAPLQLSLANTAQGDPSPWVFEPSVVAGMLTVKRVDNGGQVEIHVGLESGAFAQLLIPIAGQVDRKAKNARFRFNDTTRQLDLIENSTVGRVTDVPATITAVNDALMRGEHSVLLAVKEEQPAVADTATSESLGIRESVSEQTTYFRDSKPARMTNIEIAAKRFDGIFVAPGATFSMGEALGDVSLDNGFAEAWIIYGDRTIKGVGGGVCQVSTTLFRTAFFGGFPIVERHSHAYRVSSYEQNASTRDPMLAGLDATVYFPLVDFKFVNDTPYWLLMETYFNPTSQSLTWKFYSTSDGRSVTFDASGPRNIVPAPAPLFEVNPELKVGQIEQVDWAADGADATIVRTVWKNGAIYFTDTFTTHYEPWQAVCQYGPETEDVEKLAKKKGLCQSPGT
jgi:vancomycin resistance protein YoaR